MLKLNMERSKIVLYLCISAILITLTSSLCLQAPDLCSHCRGFVRCRHNRSLVIPQTLQESIYGIEVLYNGQDKVIINEGMFSRYDNLDNISISGPKVVGLKKGTFQYLNKLEKLRIHRTQVDYIPDELLPVNSLIKQLTLTNNRLTRMPYKLFQYLPLLEHLNLAFNSIVIPDCTSIGSQFDMLPRLTTLTIGNVTVNRSCEGNVSASFFQPIQRSIKILHLHYTNLLLGDHPTILANLTLLEELDLSLAEGFSSCPSTASILFKNLPPSLRSLYFRRWRTFDGDMPSEQCRINNSSFMGLKALPNLTKLDMLYSDFIFGHVLEKSLFSGFNALEELNVGWCRLSLVQDFAFDGCPKLNWVSFDGNPVSSRPVSLYSLKNASKLSNLELTRVSISSDYARAYNFSRFLINAPLEIINLRGNYLLFIPIFAGSREVNYLTVKKIILDGNYLWHLSSSDEDINFGVYCKTFPNLREFSARENQLQNVTGLCDSLTLLNLADNKLTQYWDINRDIISQLKNLETLDLSENEIQNIPANFFSSMTRLKEIHLEGNHLTAVQSSFLERNPMIEVINLKDNVLSEIQLNSIRHLRRLRKLLVDQNSITLLDKDLINYLKNSTSMKIFGIFGNPLQCKCDQYFVQEFINETDLVPEAAALFCHGPERLRGDKIYNYYRDNYLCDHAPMLRKAFIVLGSILAAVLLALPCYRYRWYITHSKVVARAIFDRISAVQFERKCLYDAYVMYNSNSDEDLNFVVEHLRPNVEKENTGSNHIENLKLYLHDRDALPGTSKYTEMLSAMEKSRKIILVLSNSYLATEECRGQADLAGREAYGLRFYQPNKILVLVTERLNEDTIETPFTSLLTETVIDVYDASDNDMKRIWHRIRRFISKSRYEYRRKVTDESAGQSNDVLAERTAENVRDISSSVDTKRATSAV